MHCRANVIVNDDIIIGLKSSILGYISRGDNVPDVITTDWNLSNTGRIAMLASKHRKCSTGSTFAPRAEASSEGSMIIEKPLVYVDTNVAKCATTVSGEKSPICGISKVRINDERRSAQNLNGFLSMQTFFITSEMIY